MTPEIEKLEAEYNALAAERLQLKADIQRLEQELLKKKERYSDLSDRYNHSGLVRQAKDAFALAKLKHEDSRFPTWNEAPSEWGSRKIITDVTDKWITIRIEGMRGSAKRYRRSDGLRERARNWYNWNSIDHEKAVRIWEEWKSKQ